MILSKSEDIMMFYRIRKECRDLFNDDGIPVCKSSGRICDEDTCRIIKDSEDIDDFIEIIKRGSNEKNGIE